MEPPVAAPTISPAAKPFGCKEPACSARYARKGDLARHKREQHSDEEYLCPCTECLWNRKGHGFKRMHRLVSHLCKPMDLDHPVALSRLDARYIAVDYNDGLSSVVQQSFSSSVAKETRDSLTVTSGLGDLSQYADRLQVIHCPESKCHYNTTGSISRLGLVGRHLMDTHRLSWEMAFSVASKAAEAQQKKANS